MSLYTHESSIAAQAALDAPVPEALKATDPAAKALYGAPEPYKDTTVSAEKRAERAESTSRTLYSAQSTYGAVIPDDASDVLDVKAAREVAADFRVDANDAAELVSMLRQLPNVSEEERTGWHEQSVALNIPKADMDRARAFVEKDKRVFDLLDHTGLGSHPRVVQTVVHMAREAAMRGGK